MYTAKELHTCNNKACLKTIQDFPTQTNRWGLWYWEPLNHIAGLWLVQQRFPFHLQLEVIQSIDTDAFRRLELYFEDIYNAL